MVSNEEVKKIANLAKLDISEAELPSFTEKMNQILGFIESLSKLDTEGVEPTSHAADVVNAFRLDEVRSNPIQEKVFEAAPKQEDHLFMVPKVIG